jgi:hypothetical protein
MPALMKLMGVMGAMAGVAVMGGVLMLASQHWLMVKVDTTGPDEVHLIVPVPVGLLQAGVVFMPEEARRVKIDKQDLPIDVQDLRRLAEALEQAPDGVYVKVTSPRENVRIEKKGGNLNIFVKTEQEKVEMCLPIAFLKGCLDGMDKDGFNTSAAIDALSELRHTKIVDVDAPDAKVSIYSW